MRGRDHERAVPPVHCLWQNRANTGATPVQPYLAASAEGNREYKSPTNRRLGDIAPVGLTACRGDGSRDTVEEKLAILSLSSGGAPDGSRDAPNHLAGRVSGLRAEPSAACPCPARRTGR